MPRLDADSLERLRRLLDDGRSCREAAATLGVSAATAIRWAQRGGLVSRRARRLAPALREALRARLAAGATPAEAAAALRVSEATAAREAARRPRSEQERWALDALERGARPRTVAAAFDLDEAAMARLATHWRLRPERLAQRARLFKALSSGLSRRQAAAEAGVPVATAIRWARAQPPSPRTP